MTHQHYDVETAIAKMRAKADRFFDAKIEEAQDEQERIWIETQRDLMEARYVQTRAFLNMRNRGWSASKVAQVMAIHAAAVMETVAVNNLHPALMKAEFIRLMLEADQTKVSSARVEIEPMAGGRA
ncbi:MAG: hypothetical protein Q4F71_10800 [Paracoccus sp. (in: a-proteobacteria)]|nr:hypothetical protein [Paracoccus sp. (in: a-proteobacteria)]